MCHGRSKDVLCPIAVKCVDGRHQGDMTSVTLSSGGARAAKGLEVVKEMPLGEGEGYSVVRSHSVTGV